MCVLSLIPSAPLRIRPSWTTSEGAEHGGFKNRAGPAVQEAPATSRRALSNDEGVSSIGDMLGYASSHTSTKHQQHHQQDYGTNVAEYGSNPHGNGGGGGGCGGCPPIQQLWLWTIRVPPASAHDWQGPIPMIKVPIIRPEGEERFT
jgi:hypothetical protein